MKYLKSERLKFKHSFSNRLLWIAPFMTAVLAWIIGGFVGFQYLTFYWWYMFLLPGTIAICVHCPAGKKNRQENIIPYSPCPWI